MKWQKILIVVVVGVLVGAIGIELYMLLGGRGGGGAPTSQLRRESQVPTPTSAPAATWDDPAGFSFQYSADMAVDNHEEDNENYAHVELTHEEHPGSLIVWASDPPPGGQTDVTAWVRATKRFEGANSIDTMLGGQAAKKIVLTTPKRMVITGVIYDGLLFYIETTLDETGYWQKEHDRVVDSFAFVQKEPSEEAQGSGEISVDEEEVVE